LETETFKNNSTVWIEKLASDRFKIEANALQSFINGFVGS